jgi:hypothetical protein
MPFPSLLGAEFQPPTLYYIALPSPLKLNPMEFAAGTQDPPTRESVACRINEKKFRSNCLLLKSVRSIFLLQAEL